MTQSTCTPPLTMRHLAHNRNVHAITLCLAAYLYGSLPLVYLLGRRGGIDLKATGSGNVGGSNLWTTRGAAAAIIGWLFDASKGLLPVVAGRQITGDAAVARLAGVCGVVGQCWPIFLDFNGGRGISSFVGASFMIDRAAWPAALLPMISGSLWRVVGLRRRTGARSLSTEMKEGRGKVVPFSCLIGVVTFALVAHSRSRHSSCRALTIPAAPLLALVIIVRRLTAPLPDDVAHGPTIQPRALLFRLLYDRNTSR